jgi:PAS domain S-box-containing protein
MALPKRFVFVFFPLLILGVFALGLFYYVDRERARANLESQEQRVVELASRVIQNDLAGVEGDLLYLSQQHLLGVYLAGATDSWTRLLAEDYANFIREKGIYDQIRLLDINGQELIRVNYSNGRPRVVSDSELQNKGDRYYFRDAIALDPGQIYVSPLDLNVEHGEIEQPLKPMLRFAIPLFDGADQRRGVLVLNYLADRLIKQLRDLSETSTDELWLVNGDGYWLIGPRPQDEWGFMYPERADRTVARQYPDLWSWLRSGSRRIGYVGGALFARMHICGDVRCVSGQDGRADPPLLLGFRGSDFPWTVVTRVTPESLNAAGMMSSGGYWLYGIAAVLVGIVVLSGRYAWGLTATVSALGEKEGELRKSRELVQSFVDYTPSPVFIKDREGRYLLSNRKTEALLGLNRQDLLGKTDFDLIDKELAEVFRFHDNEVLEKDRSIQFEESLPTPQGLREFLSMRFPIRDTDGHAFAIGGIAADMTERRAAERAAAESELKFKALLESAPDGVLITDNDGIMVLINGQVENLFGYDRSELIGKSVDMLMSAGVGERFVENPLTQVTGRENDIEGVRKDETRFPMEISLSPLATEGGSWVIAIVRDVSEHRKFERQLRQSQKMEAIGQLTGGLAHDFNNLLGIVMGNLDMLERGLAGDDRALKRVDAAQKAVLRGADLTKRLLAFARRQSLAPQPTDVSDLVSGLAEMLPRTLGRDVEVVTELDPEKAAVLVDPSELENALLNLAINARDAMPDGGKLYIKTEQIHLDEDYVRRQGDDFEAGPYVRIAVVDTGCGMSPQVLDRVFEPFFTTKEQGKGTGLGLAMIYGFVKQSKGHVRIYSEVGHGTAVNIYLPQVESEVGQAQGTRSASDASPGGSETVLVVDDEPELLDIAVAFLEDAGYTVHRASSGSEALEVLHSGTEIDLLLTDIVMPGGMNGLELARQALSVKPSLGVLYASGFSAEVVEAKSGPIAAGKLINKPYRRDGLVRAVRAELDRDVGTAGENT